MLVVVLTAKDQKSLEAIRNLSHDLVPPNYQIYFLSTADIMLLSSHAQYWESIFSERLSFFILSGQKYVLRSGVKVKNLLLAIHEE